MCYKTFITFCIFFLHFSCFAANFKNITIKKESPHKTTSKPLFKMTQPSRHLLKEQLQLPKNFNSKKISNSKNRINIKNQITVKNKTNQIFVAHQKNKKISLHFQNIKTKNLLYLLAKFSDINIVVSEQVLGSISLNLQNVLCSTAFDFILNNQGLAFKKYKDIIYISQKEDILSQEKISQEYQALTKSSQKLKTKYIQINYANPKDIIAILLENENFLLSSKGKISFDKRTNILLIKDYDNNIKEIKKFLKNIDIPLKQVIIETKIVKVTRDFKKAFGIKFGTNIVKDKGSFNYSLSSNVAKNKKLLSNSINNRKTNILKENSNPFTFDFKLSEVSSNLGFSLAKLPKGILLDLELQALEKENKATIFARPKLLTLDKQTAIIEAGKEIPYITKGRNNTDPYVIFKKAVLKLEVTPFISPKGKILLDLKINKDQPGIQVSGVAQAPIDTTKITTKVITNNGETIVLGGIFSERKININYKVPFLGDLPLFGNLFKSNEKKCDRSEILIFVTPKLVQ